MTNIKALKPFTYRNSSTGDVMSIAAGAVASVEDSLAADFIADGLAEAYTLITPTGTKSITANGNDIDVATYAKVNVAVPEPPEPTGNIEITSTASVDVAAYATAQVVDANLIAGNIKKDVTILGVTGTYEA